MSTMYIKGGYKVDRDKLKAMYGRREDDPENTRFLAIWEKFPLHFKYLGNRREPDGNVALVLVLKDGYNRERLETTAIPRDAKVQFGSVLPEFCRTQNRTLRLVREICQT